MPLSRELTCVHHDVMLFTGAGGDKAGSVPVTGYRLLRLGVDGVAVPRHPGASIYIISRNNSRRIS